MQEKNRKGEILIFYFLLLVQNFELLTEAVTVLLS